MDSIINKVAQSELITIDLADYIPNIDLFASFDIKDFLFKELILKEKDFRLALSNFDWNQYTGKYVSVYCSTDAIIPVWAYMLVSSCVTLYAKSVFLGTKEEHFKYVFINNIYTISTNEYLDKKVVIKGCGEIHIPEYAFLEITTLLMPLVKSLMYGEPCSTVPIYKKSKIV